MKKQKEIYPQKIEAKYLHSLPNGENWIYFERIYMFS